MDLVQEKKTTAIVEAINPLGLYLHVPFCYTRCDFCAFYEKTPAAGEIYSYIKTVEQELALYGQLHRVDTIFWGGGTPGILSAKDIRLLGEILLNKFTKPAEWSIELAPASVTATKLRALKDIGVNRISLGVQSFDDQVLRSLGRDHSLQQINRAYDLIRKEGFPSVNIDMMFALPGQSINAWEKDLEELKLRDPDHVSTYCLTFEEDTRLYAKLASGKIVREPRKEADFYEYTWERLSSLGYDQYEVSNFSKRSHSCIHNLNTWKMNDWVGLGPSASSQFGGRRYTNVADLKEWKDGVEQGEPVLSENDELSDFLLCQDSFIFGLRLVDGVDLKKLKIRFGQDIVHNFTDCIDTLIQDGLLLQKGERVIPTQSGLLLADRMGEMLLDC